MEKNTATENTFKSKAPKTRRANICCRIRPKQNLLQRKRKRQRNTLRRKPQAVQKVVQQILLKAAAKTKNHFSQIAGYNNGTLLGKMVRKWYANKSKKTTPFPKSKAILIPFSLKSRRRLPTSSKTKQGRLSSKTRHTRPWLLPVNYRGFLSSISLFFDLCFFVYLFKERSLDYFFSTSFIGQPDATKQLNKQKT